MGSTVVSRETLAAPARFSAARRHAAATIAPFPSHPPVSLPGRRGLAPGGGAEGMVHRFRMLVQSRRLLRANIGQVMKLLRREGVAHGQREVAELERAFGEVADMI